MEVPEAPGYNRLVKHFITQKAFKNKTLFNEWSFILEY
jgi:hypothetical protein